MENNMNKFERKGDYVKKNKKEKIAYKIGYGIGITMLACILIAIIALTIKLLLWLF